MGKGELHLTLIGLVVQFASQIFETVRLLLTEVMLTSAGIRLDALTFTLLVMPCCFLVLVLGLMAAQGSAAIGSNFPGLRHPGTEDVLRAAPLLLANCANAFALNVFTSLYIKRTSAVTSMVTQLVKDCLIVVASVSVLGEAVTGLQVVGISALMVTCFLYALMQRFPIIYDEHGIVCGTLVALRGKA